MESIDEVIKIFLNILSGFYISSVYFLYERCKSGEVNQEISKMDKKALKKLIKEGKRYYDDNKHQLSLHCYKNDSSRMYRIC